MWPLHSWLLTAAAAEFTAGNDTMVQSSSKPPVEYLLPFEPSCYIDTSSWITLSGYR